mmetsp:Transcript_26614/g.30451  ORF Transcript_26614/g.30451 Transcript_26614/m.30451 type:complete len:247 (+) Transcript_26614:226-966(+)
MMKHAILIINLICTIPAAYSLTNGIDVFQNIDNCPTNKAGPPSCSIPYETCADNKTKCFNNSKCVQDEEKDPVTGQNTYSCDCAYAGDSTEYFAGVYCENSSTEICDGAKDGYGCKFCTNGGMCSTWIFKGETHWGCMCASDYGGAYCQYHTEDMNYGLIGEQLIPDVGDNFWGLVPTVEKQGRNVGLEAMAAVGITLMLAITIAFIIVVRNKKKGKQNQTMVDTNTLEANGSGTMPGIEGESEIL